MGHTGEPPTRLCALFTALLLGNLTVVYTPTVQLVAPSKSISISLDMKIGHEVYIRVGKVPDGIINENSGLF